MYIYIYIYIYISCQLSELTFLLAIAFRATKILSTVGVDIPVSSGFRATKSCQLSELTFLLTIDFPATKILWELTFLLTVAFQTA